MCEANSDANYTPPGSTYMVQRSWSNHAALAGTNPCVPVPAGDGPYFNSYPTLPDTVTLGGNYWSTPVAIPGVLIPVGQTRTIDIVLQSQAPTSGPWTVNVLDLSQYRQGEFKLPARDRAHAGPQLGKERRRLAPHHQGAVRRSRARW